MEARAPARGRKAVFEQPRCARVRDVRTRPEHAVGFIDPFVEDSRVVRCAARGRPAQFVVDLPWLSGREPVAFPESSRDGREDFKIRANPRWRRVASPPPEDTALEV